LLSELYTNLLWPSKLIKKKGLCILVVKIFYTELLVMWTFCPLISQSDIVSINDLTLILKYIGHRDFKYIMTLQMKIITPVLKILTYIITSITSCPYQTRCNTWDTFCLYLHSYRYSMYVIIEYMHTYREHIWAIWCCLLR